MPSPDTSHPGHPGAGQRSHPLAFVSTEGTTRDPRNDSEPSVSYRCEVVGAEGRFEKIGLVEDLATGRVWRLAADEGKYLRGTGLAPSPLMHWGAGLHGDVTARIAELAASEGTPFDDLEVTMSQGFASRGSFAKGEAVADVFDLSWEVKVFAEQPIPVIESVVARALLSSPASAAMISSHDGKFALYANGRTVATPSVPQALTNVSSDPFRRHSSSPGPVSGGADTSGVLAERPGTSGVLVGSDDQVGSMGWHVRAHGHFDFASRTTTSTVGFPELASAETWALVSDPTNYLAPSPLSYFSLGTAFCFHTQLCRYSDVRRLPIASPRLSQTSRFISGQDEVGTDPFETHLFLNGSITNEDASNLLLAAANTCYAHRALSVDVIAASTTEKAPDLLRDSR